MGKKSYKPGSVSEILSKNNQSSPNLDPKLCDVFASTAFVRKPDPVVVETEEKKFMPKKGPDSQLEAIKKAVKKARALNLQRRDAAPVEQTNNKRKSEADVKVGPPSKKQKHNQIKTEAISPANTAESDGLTGKVGKQKKDGKKAKQGKVKKNKKKKLQMEKFKKEMSSDEEDDELSKVPEDMEKVIEDFEREQSNSGPEDDSEDEDNEGAENEERKPKKLKNFELNAPKLKNPELENRTVFVGNLPTGTKEKVIRRLFKEFGNVEAVRFRGAVPLKPYLLKKAAANSKKLSPDQYNISAYVRFASREEAEKAAKEMNGHMLEKHSMVVDLADNKKQDNRKAVFVGNIPLKVEDDQLRKFFTECGKIFAVRIIRNPTTGLSKGFGFVNFELTESVELALKKDGEDFEGRALRVTRHSKKEKKPKGDQKGKAKPEVADGKNRVNRNNAMRRIEKRQKGFKDTNFTGDKLAEIGALKRKSNKPNKNTLRKTKIAALLTGTTTTQIKKRQKETGK